MKKKILALALCLTMLLASFATFGVAAADDTGFTYDETTKTYTVTTADGLLAAVAEINTGKFDRNITLAADIDLDGKTWIPIGSKAARTEENPPAVGYYKGVIDGANFTIKNLKYEGSADSGAGIIGAATGGCEVKNLNVSGAVLKDKSMVAVIIGYTEKDAEGTVKVENVHIRACGITATASYGYAAAIIGEVGSKSTYVNNCTIVANITAIRASGVIGGDSAGNIAADDTVNGIKISNTIVAGSITHKLVGTSSGNKYGASGFLGSNSTMPLSLTNCVCVAKLTVEDATKAGIGAAILLINKNNLTANNVIINAPFAGDVGDFTTFPVSISNTKVYLEGSTDAEVSLYGKETTKEGTVTIDGTKLTAAKDAKLPVINTEVAMITAVKTIFVGNQIITSEVIDDIFHEHVYTEVESEAFVKTAPTCTEPGVYYKSCTCGEMDKNATFEGKAALGHSTADKWTNDNENHWHVCPECLEEKTDVGAHTFGEWKVTKEATEIREGERTKACTVCGLEVTEKIAKLTPAADTEAPAADTDAPAEVEGGCGGTVFGVSAVLVATLGAGVTCLRKKED